MSDNFLMKGKVWAEHKHKLSYPVSAEVKHDEIRLHVKRTGASIEFLSYEGKPQSNLDSWAWQFADAMIDLELMHLDMGVLVNGNFNDSFRWCRSSSGIPKEKLNKKTGKIAPALARGMVEFYLFDIPESALIYGLRTFERNHVSEMLNKVGIPTKIPHAIVCESEEEVDAAFMQFRSQGHEGAMVKSFGHKYAIGKRIDGWLKMKPEAEADGKVVGFKEAISEDGVPLGRVGSFLVDVEDGSSAAPAAGISHEFAKLIWENQDDYLNEPCVFNYMERDRSGGYRHPIFGRFREPK